MSGRREYYEDGKRRYFSCSSGRDDNARLRAECNAPCDAMGVARKQRARLHDCLQTIADESSGPHPGMSDDALLAEIEQTLHNQRIQLERMRDAGAQANRAGAEATPRGVAEACIEQAARRAGWSEEANTPPWSWLEAEVARLQAAYDSLTGERFSDRCHAALKSRAADAETKVGRLREESGALEKTISDLLERNKILREEVGRAESARLLKCEASAGVVKWKYHSQNCGGNVHDAVEYVNKCHPEWEVISFVAIQGGTSIIVWRESPARVAEVPK